jgi:hypothetical protein
VVAVHVAHQHRVDLAEPSVAGAGDGAAGVVEDPGPSGSGPEVRMIFETLNGAVTRYRVGRMPEVAWVESCG